MLLYRHVIREITGDDAAARLGYEKSFAHKQGKGTKLQTTVVLGIKQILLAA